MKIKKQSGFTLIELLVVIAIIGILASIVLVSLGGARTRARDARITADLNQIRTIGEMILSSDANYTNVASSTDVQTLLTDINSQGAITNADVYANAAGYCAKAQMGGGKWGCVNSGLTAIFTLTSAVNCNGTASTTPGGINCN